MSLRSMTGFARVERDAPGPGFAWELRAVNGKGLDLRLRLPAGLEDIEPEVRRMIGAALGRGSIQAALSLRRDAAAETAGFRINELMLGEVLRLSDALVSEGRAAPPRADGLLALRGVIEAAEPDSEATALGEHRADVLAALAQALHALRTAREEEGRALAAVLQARLREIETLTASAESHPARQLPAIRARLAEQVAALVGDDGLDEARLHQEAALLAARADIREELDRLTAHVAAARDLLSRDEPVGRRLDFLCQEFNREANTLCAKSNAAALTAIGLDLKLAVDQFREQVQNIE